MRAGREAVELRLVRDSGGFVRRSCPSCDRHFKVPGRGVEEALVHAAILGAVPHANAGELGPAEPRACPYCGHLASAEAFLTTVQRAWVEQWSKSLASELRVTQLRQLEQRLGQNPYLTYVVVPPLAPPARLPAEPDDMAALRVSCCDDEVKLKGSWLEPYYCPRCRSRQIPPGWERTTEQTIAAALDADGIASA